MSQRHTLVTSYLYAPVEDVARVDAVLRDACFRVDAHRGDGGDVTWFSAMFKDLAIDTYALEYEWLPGLVAQLNGLLPHSWTIAVTWENDYEDVTHSSEGCGRQHVWAVQGRAV